MKEVQDLIQRFALPVGIIGSLITIGGFLFAVLRIIPELARFIGRLFKKESIYYDVPKRTVVFALMRSNSCRWQLGKSGARPLMLLNGETVLTNLTKERVRIIGTIIKKPYTEGQVWVKSQLASTYSGIPVDIPPKGTADVVFMFQISPPASKPGRSFRCKLALVDQYGNRNWHSATFSFVP